KQNSSTNLSVDILTQHNKKTPRKSNKRISKKSLNEKFENCESSTDELIENNESNIEGILLILFHIVFLHKVNTSCNIIEYEHEIENSKKKGKGRKYEVNYFNHSSVLSQILNEITDEDPENAWIYINSRLETIFGRDQSLKSPEDVSKSKYLKLISELQDCEFLNQYKEPIKLWKIKAENTFGHEALKSIQTMATSQKRKANEDDLIIQTPIKKVKWEVVADNLNKKVNNSNDNLDETAGGSILMVSLKATNSDINSIKEELITWNITFKKYNEIERSLKIEKLKLFVSLKQHYINLFYAATQETPHGSKSLPSKTKIEKSIPLGKNPPPKILRGWISHHICSTLLVSERTERKIWNSLCLLVALLSNGVITYESLVDAEATPNFFLKMKESDRQKFYKRFTGNEIIYKPFLQIGNEIEDDNNVNDEDSILKA
ncbi:1983_t:CDS:2, partial [Cetraspora pellucida]